MASKSRRKKKLNEKEVERKTKKRMAQGSGNPHRKKK